MRSKVYILILIIGSLFFSCNRIKKKVGQVFVLSKTIAKEAKTIVEDGMNPNAIKLFEQTTGLTVKDSIWSVQKNDTYFPHEGEFSIVFTTTDSQIEQWIENKPPWNSLDWKKGAIPRYIFNCKF